MLSTQASDDRSPDDEICSRCCCRHCSLASPSRSRLRHGIEAPQQHQALDTILGLHRDGLPEKIRSLFLPQDLIIFQPDDSLSEKNPDIYISELEHSIPASSTLSSEDAAKASAILARCNLCDIEQVTLGAFFIIAAFSYFALMIWGKPGPFARSLDRKHYHSLIALGLVPHLLIAPIIMVLLRIIISKRWGRCHAHLMPWALWHAGVFLPGAWRTKVWNVPLRVARLIEVWKMKHVQPRAEPNLCRFDDPTYPFQPLGSRGDYTRRGGRMVRLEEAPVLFDSSWRCLGWLNVAHGVYRDWQRVEAARALFSGTEDLEFTATEYSIRELDDGGKEFSFFPLDF